MKKFGRIMAGLATGFAFVAAANLAAAKDQLNVYTALEADQVRDYKTAFEKAYPDIEIVWTRDSTGVITAKLLAEKANPRADYIWGVAATSLLVLDGEGMLEPYAPKGIEKISPQFKDSKPVPAWVGIDVWGATICFNTVEAKKKNIPLPTSWEDLTKPAYQGQIVMPNPASSGTGYFDVAGWLQMWGEEKGWKYMDALHQNMGLYTHSGSAPCRMAAAGEYVAGISFEFRANKTKADGAPIELVFPKEGLGYDVEANGIVKGTKNLAAAKKLADWTITPEAMELYAKNFAVVAMPGIAKPLANVPADYETRLIKNDLGWAAKNRERILEEWQKRYAAKSEPKKN